MTLTYVIHNDNMVTVSVVCIAKNEEKNIARFLENINWANEIIVVDNGSTDRTCKIAKKYTNKVYINNETSLGFLKIWALRKATSDWILLLDVDELVSSELKNEIQKSITTKTGFDAFSIPYKNYFLDHPLKTKAQVYSKVRLFKNGKGTVSLVPVHEEVSITGKIGTLTSFISHYSFRSIPQTIDKFTNYAKRELPLLIKQEIHVNLKHFILYPLHMMYALFIKDQGYKDGIWGFGLAACFAYYEFMRYWFLWIYEIKKRFGLHTDF